MVDSAHANWNAIKKTYGDGDPSLPMVNRKCICLFHWSASLGKVTQKFINASLQFQYNQLCKDYKDAKTMNGTKTNIMWFGHDGCHPTLPQKKDSSLS